MPPVKRKNKSKRRQDEKKDLIDKIADRKKRSNVDEPKPPPMPVFKVKRPSSKEGPAKNSSLYVGLALIVTALAVLGPIILIIIRVPNSPRKDAPLQDPGIQRTKANGEPMIQQRPVVNDDPYFRIVGATCKARDTIRVKVASQQDCAAACSRIECIAFTYKNGKCSHFWNIPRTRPGRVDIDIQYTGKSKHVCHINTAPCPHAAFEIDKSKLNKDNPKLAFACFVINPGNIHLKHQNPERYLAEPKIVQNFLPVDIAEEIRQDIAALTFDPTSTEADWIYTSLSAEHTKEKGNYDIEKRRAYNMKLHYESKFSYSKWEIPTAHPLHQKLRGLFENEMKQKVEEIVGRKLSEPGDSFFALFGQDDFLSMHDDGPNGDYAVVLNFSEDWQVTDGGNLLLFRAADRHNPDNPLDCWFNTCPWRTELVATPSFNSAAIFQVGRQDYSSGIFNIRQNHPHYVTQVLSDKKRYSLTLWYFDASASQQEVEEGKYKAYGGKEQKQANPMA